MTHFLFLLKSEAKIVKERQCNKRPPVPFLSSFRHRYFNPAPSLAEAMDLSTKKEDVFRRRLLPKREKEETASRWRQPLFKIKPVIRLFGFRLFRGGRGRRFLAQFFFQGRQLFNIPQRSLFHHRTIHRLDVL